jgi:hypothetical protein
MSLNCGGINLAGHDRELCCTKGDLNSRSLQTNGPPYNWLEIGHSSLREWRQVQGAVQRACRYIRAADDGADTIISSVRTNPLLMVG